MVGRKRSVGLDGAGFDRLQARRKKDSYRQGFGPSAKFRGRDANFSSAFRNRRFGAQERQRLVHEAGHSLLRTPILHPL